MNDWKPVVAGAARQRCENTMSRRQVRSRRGKVAGAEIWLKAVKTCFRSSCRTCDEASSSGLRHGLKDCCEVHPWKLAPLFSWPSA